LPSFPPGRPAKPSPNPHLSLGVTLLRAFGLGAILFGFWLALSGHYTPLLISLGAGSSVLVVYLAVRMDVVDHEGVPLQVGGRFWMYVPWLMWEIVIANIAVAKVILDPRLPISPRMVVFHGSQKSDLGKFIYANSITLTPGTITTGVEGQEFQIHALSGADLESDDEETDMDRRCTHVEGD
jgi:multicomponent Na+:H+ antiporter subunit E